MSLKHKIAITGGLLLLLSLLLVCLLAGAYFYLPFYLEARIIPRLAADAGFSDFAVNVRNIGFFSADLGTLRIGPRENPAFVIRSVQVDYSPRSLYKRKIERITLSGIELHAELANGRFKLRGLDMAKILADTQQREQTASALNEPSLSVILERLEIRNSRVIIEHNGQFYRIPFEFDMVPQDPEYDVLDIAAHLYPRGEKITATAKVNRSERRAALSLDSATLNLDRFADITARFADFMLSGEMTLHAKAEVLWEPLQIASVNASLMLRHGKIKGGGLQLQTAMTPNNEEVPFRIDLSSKNTNEWQISGGRISMTTPTHLTLAGFDGTIKRNAATLESSGNFSAVLHSSSQTMPNQLPVIIQDPLPLQGRFAAIYHQSGKWQCDVSNHKPEGTAAKTVRLKVEPYTITSSIPEFNLSATAESENIDAAFMLTAAAVRIASGSESINIPKLILKGTAQIDNTANGSTGLRFNLRALNTGIKLKDGEIKISEFAISGKLNRDDVRQTTLEGVVQFSGGGGRFSRFGARVGGARGKIPFKWPVKGKTATGSISVTNLKYRGLELGRLSSQVHQTATGFAFEGRHQSALLPRMKLNFSGESRLFAEAPAGTRVKFQVSRPAAAPEIDLAKFYPGAKGIRIKGKFQLDGDLTLNNNGFSGMMHADFNNGNLWLGKNNLALEGIRMSLSLPELPKIRSAPGQQIHFSRISLGDFVAQKGRIDFQIESARSILIEKMHFLWCDGNVETQSMRLSPGTEDYHITFYCDRLNLAKVLEQFGAAAAEGQGSVNGRIPLQYANGKIKFDDGFLFSTPGEGGKIHLSGTDILTAGIPPDTPQYVQMELAREALKDYDYTWAKLNITSQGEELLLQMQMDGKPAKTLPFVYSKDIGGFMKVEANAKGSKFQGIRLDVNFRLPLNKLLQYKDLINMIQ
jgi:hypothetical protein